MTSYILYATTLELSIKIHKHCQVSIKQNRSEGTNGLHWFYTKQLLDIKVDLRKIIETNK